MSAVSNKCPFPQAPWCVLCWWMSPVVLTWLVIAYTGVNTLVVWKYPIRPEWENKWEVTITDYMGRCTCIIIHVDLPVDQAHNVREQHPQSTGRSTCSLVTAHVYPRYTKDKYTVNVKWRGASEGGYRLANHQVSSDFMTTTCRYTYIYICTGTRPWPPCSFTCELCQSNFSRVLYAFNHTA